MFPGFSQYTCSNQDARYLSLVEIAFLTSRPISDIRRIKESVKSFKRSEGKVFFGNISKHMIYLLFTLSAKIKIFPPLT